MNRPMLSYTQRCAGRAGGVARLRRRRFEDEKQGRARGRSVRGNQGIHSLDEIPQDNRQKILYKFAGHGVHSLKL